MNEAKKGTPCVYWSVDGKCAYSMKKKRITRFPQNKKRKDLEHFVISHY